ncbi:cytochrome P450 716B2-like [Arachis hypogaea]|uniref:cytochrome P450 716B2-like n=1 Tax=Arachis hypogaea TaxID=3818 RepID=UPI003B225C26
MAVFCSPAGNKFLFTNENKDVQGWIPSSVAKLLRSSVVNKVGEDAKMARKLLLSFLSAEALQEFCAKNGLPLLSSHKHSLARKGAGGCVFTVQLYTYALAACLFLSEEESIHVSKFSSKLDEFVKGFAWFPVNLPRTKFRRSMKLQMK